VNKFTAISLGVVLSLAPGTLVAQHGHGGGLHLGSSMSSGAGMSVGKGITAGGGLTTAGAASMSKGLSVGSGLGSSASMGGGLSNAMGGGLSKGATMSTNHASPTAFSATSKTATQALLVSPDSFVQPTTSTGFRRNPMLLSTRAQTLLPAGTSVRGAAMGFRNQREFLTTLHVSRDLNIPFNQLKAETTGPHHESLEKAIAELRPSLSHSQIKSGIRVAERETGRDLLVSRMSTRVEGSRFLASRVQSLLPAGMTLQAAEAGFRNQGQFLAALHVSHNLGISFADLKAKMTGPNPESLGRAIQDLRPNLSKGTVKSDVEVAEREAENDTDSMLERERELELKTMLARR